MIRIALKDLLGRKLRLALTSLAVVMGVAMVSGTFVLTDTIKHGFSQIFSTALQNSDVVITGKAAFGNDQNAPSFPASALDKVLKLPGVADAAGGVADTAQFVGADGKVVSHGGAPGLAFSVNADGDQHFNPLNLLSGTWPRGRTQIAVDKDTAADLKLAVGSTVGVIPRGGAVVHLKVSGIVSFGSVGSLGGATLAIFDLPTAQTLFQKEGKLDEIDVAAQPNVPSSELVAQIKSILPPHTQVRTGEEQAAKASSDTSSALSFLEYFLLAFGFIALFVGAFVIANTLSITIAQRTREFATLRTMGATGRQVIGVVLAEGLVTGLVAATIGLFAGVGLAKGLDELFKSFGIDLPQSGLIFASRTVIVSLVLGTAVTLIASVWPAVRATRVPPIAAVREGFVLPPGRFHRLGPYVALVIIGVSLALVCVGAFVKHGIPTATRLEMLGVGVLGSFIGVAMIASRIVRPLASLLGRPAQLGAGVAGTLARANSMRNPARTASTAAALMIGLALVTIVAVLAAGVRGSFEGAVKEEFQADYALTSENGFLPTSVDSADALRKAGVAEVVAGVRAGQGRAFGKTITLTAAEKGLSQMLVLKWTLGDASSLDVLGMNGAVVDKDYAKSHHLVDGSPFTLLVPSGQELHLMVKAIFDPPSGGSPFGPVTVSAEAFDSVTHNPQNVFTFMNMSGGVTPENTAILNDVLKSYPDAKVQTESEFIANQEAGINIFLNMLFVLLGLSVIVSLFGIVNTLVLTVFERTRELGMLRAVGMTRRQTRRMIRQESIITALIGAALGIPLGVGLGGLFGQALPGGMPFIVPWGQIVIFVFAALIVGLLAAIFPARRAAKLNPLEALQYE
ncbi:MAG: FtsX-like permease family protein [Actinobacteria bacterium]|uniref:Unannotated protein n=1 Tax=freshwater metagenome TaxID=449393 RepID=A0A6J6QM09_9ZZZZ|nr:FtsX-like permease family protein [Actinomycetota bacterium]